MRETLEFIKVNAKAIATFFLGLMLNAIQAVVSGQAPWPQTLKAWGVYLGTSLIAGVAVWATGNKLTVPQIVNGAVQQGVTVIGKNAIDTVANAAENAIENAVKNKPYGAPMNDVAQQVSNTVTTVLKGVADNFPTIPLDFKNVL